MSLGRSAPGESWKRAMAIVAERIAEGSRKRYRVQGYRIEPGWWAYEVKKVTSPPPVKKPPEPMTRDRLDELGRTLPRCAQRARETHGGGTKLAFPDQRLAAQVAAFLGHRAYRCPLPAPAIGEHWHVTTSKRKKRR